MNVSEKAALKVEIRKIYSAVVTYIQDNMDVNDVEVSSGASLLDSPTPLVPVPNDGGSVVSTQMVANAENNILLQSGKGTVE